MTDLVALKAANAARWPKLTKKTDLKHQDLLEVLFYCPETGKFTWRKRVSIRIVVGSEAGSVTADGYIEIGLFGQRFQAHRLAWFYMTGEWPKGQIDHKNTNASDTRWDNLREASHGQNVQNSGVRNNNTSGFKGVSFVKDIGKWHARIMADRKLHLLGYFDTSEEAHEAYAAKAAQLHGEFARAA